MRVIFIMTFNEKMYDALHDLGRLVESIRDCEKDFESLISK